MASNKDISNYFAIELCLIREGFPLPFDLYLHLSLNQRIVHFRIKNEPVEEGFLETYRQRNVDLVYIPNHQRMEYEHYLMQSEELRNAQILADAVVSIEGQTEQIQGEAEGQNKNSPYLEDPQQTQPDANAELTDDQNERLASAMKKLTSKDPAKRLDGVDQCRALAKEVVMPGEANNSVFFQLWDAAQEKHASGHGANVATFSVLFAMALENHERSLLKDIALAGLVHDLGLSQLETSVVRTPSMLRTKEQQAHFEGHLGLTLQLLTGLDIMPPPRTAAIILQHHEKFDGTGYPRHLKNWDIQALAQTLSMADIFDTMFQGQYDGNRRTITEAFRDIVTIEKSKIFPQYYNPDLFSKLTKWIQSNTDEVILDDASLIVEETFDAAKKKVV